MTVHAVFHATSAAADLLPRTVQTIGPSAATVRESLVPAACVLRREREPRGPAGERSPIHCDWYGVSCHRSALHAWIANRTANPRLASGRIVHVAALTDPVTGSLGGIQVRRTACDRPAG